MKAELPLVLAAALAFGSLPAAAQTQPGAPGTSQVIPEKHKDQPISDQGVTSGRSTTLSDKLNASDGVIAPKGNIDPGMTKTAPVPNPNSTPVIPPPGSPGGAGGAIPK